MQENDPEDVARALLAKGKKGKAKGKHNQKPSDFAGKGRQPENQICPKCTDSSCKFEGSRCKNIGKGCFCEQCKTTGHNKFSCWQRKENERIVPAKGKPKGKGKDDAKNQSWAHGAVIDESFHEAPVEGVPEKDD